MGHSSSTLMLSEESFSGMKVCISIADGRVWVWQRRGERYADACVMERDKWSEQGIMVWGAIGISHKSGPVIYQNIGPGRGNGSAVYRNKQG